MRFSSIVVSWQILIRHSLGRFALNVHDSCNAFEFYVASSKLDAGLAEADSAEGPARAIVQSNSYGWVAMLYDMCLTCERLPLQEAVFASRRFCVILDFPLGEENKKKKMMTELASKSCDA